MTVETGDGETWERLIAEWASRSDDLYAGLGDEGSRSADMREWWRCTSEVLTEMRTMLANGRSLSPSPDPVLKAMAGISAYLVSGTIPGPVRDVQGRGKPGIGPTEAKDISFAVAYMRLCESGAIDDPARVSTVAKAYGIKRQTAQGWKVRPISRDVAALMHDPAAITHGMWQAGDFYQKFQRRRGKGPI